MQEATSAVVNRPIRRCFGSAGGTERGAVGHAHPRRDKRLTCVKARRFPHPSGAGFPEKLACERGSVWHS